MWESYIDKPIGTRAVPQFTTGVAKPLTLCAVLFYAVGLTHFPAHDGAVIGMAVDSTNKHLVTAGATDGCLRIWDFKKQQLRAEVNLGCALTHLVLHPGSALAAVAGSDLVVVMVDIEAGRVVRRFTGHR